MASINTPKDNQNTTAVDETRERIISAAEEVLRRHGPEKTKIIDIVRHLGMSHSNVYRYFDNKASIEDVVAERWLAKLVTPLEKYTTGRGLAANRLRKWVHELIEIKIRHFEEDPELFATYHNLSKGLRPVISKHIAHLKSQIAKIVSDGKESGEFNVSDIEVASRAILEGITRYHHPYFVSQPTQRSDAVSPVLESLILGLKNGVM
jgi:AcrR family transcriptional regulator